MIVMSVIGEVNAPIDLRGLVPEALAGLTLDEIRRRPLRAGRDLVPVGELFKVRGTPDATLALIGVTPHMHGLGAGMRQGLLRLEGDCGDYVGADLRGGQIHVHGNARDLLGAGMRDGLIEVEGAVGEALGGPLDGAVGGMRGGTVLVARTAGRRLGDRMRRGVVVVGGDCGERCGSQMIAGTIVVLGKVGAGAGTGMRRGSLLLRDAAAALPDTFVRTGQGPLSFVTVLGGYLGALKPALATRLRAFRHPVRWVGDRGCGGLGEILLAGA